VRYGPLANHIAAWKSDAWDWPGGYQRDAASRLLNADQRQTWFDELERLEATHSAPMCGCKPLSKLPLSVLPTH